VCDRGRKRRYEDGFVSCLRGCVYRERIFWDFVMPMNVIDLVSWPEVHAGAMRWMRLRKQVIAT
jgi:hypothetical protein